MVGQASWARSPPPEKHAAKHWLTTLGFAALAALGGGAFVHYWQPTREERVFRRLALPSPDDGTITGASGNVILSPEAVQWPTLRPLVGKSTLWVRRLEGRFALSLVNTEGAVFPFWSPDSRSLGFFANGKLMRIEVAGGEPRTICDAGVPRGGSWSSNGEIVFARFRSALSRVSASGGNPVPLTKVDRAVGRSGDYTPWILPGGRFLYYLRTAKRETQGVYVASLSKPDERTWLVGSTSGAIFAPPTGSAPGVLLYVNGTTLFAQPFDPNSLRMSGKPVTIAESVNFNPGSQVPASVSNNGLLLHHPERSGVAI